MMSNLRSGTIRKGITLETTSLGLLNEKNERVSVKNILGEGTKVIDVVAIGWRGVVVTYLRGGAVYHAFSHDAPSDIDAAIDYEVWE